MADRLAAARDLLRRFPVIDGHNDLPWEIRERFAGDPSQVSLAERVPETQTDLPRLAAGGVGGQFWSVYVPASLPGDAAVTAVLGQIDIVHQMIRRYPGRLELATSATTAQVADHIEHVRSVAGIDHIGIGGDFDGGVTGPAGLEDVSGYPALFAELLDRGWTDKDCAALASGNILRVLRDAEAVAGPAGPGGLAGSAKPVGPVAR
jgi:microsomal dipeptidase-like Zn-dependent dipeptidase